MRQIGNVTVIRFGDFSWENYFSFGWKDAT